MGIDAYILIATIILALFLFVTEKVSIDLTAILIAVILMVTGVVTVPEGLSGFSNQASITILALLILSAGLEETGLLKRVAHWLAGRASSSVPLTLLLIMLPAAFFSAFLNNTAVITILLPVVVTMASKKNISPSLLLMPLAFVSILGGMTTLIGTSTNLLVNSVARQYNMEVLGFFEFAPYGLVGVAICVLFFVLGGYRLIPERRNVREYSRKFGDHKYQATITVEGESPTDSKTIKQLLKDKDIEVLKLLRNGVALNYTDKAEKLESGDRIIIKAGVQELISLQEENGIKIHTGAGKELEGNRKSSIAELVVSPSSSLVGKLFNRSSFQRKYGGNALALRQVKDTYFRSIGKRLFAVNRINIGDSILVEAASNFFDNPEVKQDMILYRSFNEEGENPLWKQIAALSIIVGVVVLAAFDVVSIAVSALGGVVLMAFLNIFKTETLYGRIDWRIYFLLAGVIPVGVAMQNTGLDTILSDLVVNATTGLAPFWLIFSFFVATIVITNFISNNAAALLMAPVVLSLAGRSGIDPKALLMAIAFGASTCFISPMGYHTLAIIYGPGRYKFSDYMRVGLPITVIIAIVFSLMLDFNFNGDAALVRAWAK